MDEEDILSSVSAVFETMGEEQEDCKNGLLFVERMAALGYEIPAQVIIDYLQPRDTMEGAWVLTTAVALGLGNTARLLIKAGTNLKVQDIQCCSPLHIAVKQNKPALVRMLLETGLVLPDDLTGDFDTPLILAAEGGCTGCVRVLLEHGASVNILSYENYSPLHWSACRGDSESLQLLLAQEGVEYDGENEHGLTPLMYAVEGEHIECVQLLLGAGADVKEKNRGAAHMAAFRNRVDILKVLIEAGAPLEGDYATDYIRTSMTPLHIASCVHALDCLRLLITLGADMNARAEDRATPLHLSVGPKGAQWGRLLELPHEDEGRWKKIVEGEFHSMQLDCVSALVVGGVDVNACNKFSATALHVCASRGNTECLRLLVELGADRSSICGKGRTALHYAAVCPSPESLMFLLETGMPLDDKDTKGKTALHAAAKLRCISDIVECFECIKILINAGSDMEATTSSGQRPLDILLVSGQNMIFNMKQGQREMLRECVNLLSGNWDEYFGLHETN